MRKLSVLLWNALLSLTGNLTGLLLGCLVREGWLYFPFVSEFLSLLPFSPGWKLRRSIYSHILPAIGTDTVLHFGVTLEDERSVIGQDVWISRNCYVDYAIIGNHVLIGPETVLLSGKHHHKSDRFDIPIKLQGNYNKIPLQIGDGVWIGANATVMADVGHDAIVGAGAVVTKAVPPLAIVAGSPARLLRYRTEADPRTSDLTSSHENVTASPHAVGI